MNRPPTCYAFRCEHYAFCIVTWTETVRGVTTEKSTKKLCQAHANKLAHSLRQGWRLGREQFWVSDVKVTDELKTAWGASR